jgi:hypothetical protein
LPRLVRCEQRAAILAQRQQLCASITKNKIFASFARQLVFMISMNERFSNEPFDETKVADFVCDLAESQYWNLKAKLEPIPLESI